MARDATSMLSDHGLEAPIESPEASEHPVDAPGRRETLFQRAEEEEGPELTKAEFRELLKDPDRLYEEIVELIAKTRDLQAYSENYRAQLRETKQALHKNEAIIDKLLERPAGRAQSETPAPEGRRTVKLPDPPLFEGRIKDGITFDNWVIQVKNKLRGNSDSYPSEDLKIIYVAGRVGGDALALISPRLNTASRHAYETVAELYKHLDDLYGDPNKERNARQAFKDLGMKKGQTFQEFYALFLRHVADGNINPQDLKDDLNDKLTWKLQETVATYYNNPDVSTTEFARHCTTNDQQIRARYERKDQTSKKADGADKSSPGSTPRQRPSGKPPSVDKPVAPKPGATDLKCYNCNELGHISRDCPKPRTERTKQVLAAKLAAVSTSTDTEGTEQGNDSP
jgi:Zinc knuckle